MKECDQLVPELLTLVKGTADSKHLLLNISEDQSLEDIKLGLMVMKEYFVKFRTCCT